MRIIIIQVLLRLVSPWNVRILTRRSWKQLGDRAWRCTMLVNLRWLLRQWLAILLDGLRLARRRQQRQHSPPAVTTAAAPVAVTGPTTMYVVSQASEFDKGG